MPQPGAGACEVACLLHGPPVFHNVCNVVARLPCSKYGSRHVSRLSHACGFAIIALTLVNVRFPLKGWERTSTNCESFSGSTFPESVSSCWYAATVPARLPCQEHARGVILLLSQGSSQACTNQPVVGAPEAAHPHRTCPVHPLACLQPDCAVRIVMMHVSVHECLHAVTCTW
jgi:hypothetical protein